MSDEERRKRRPRKRKEITLREQAERQYKLFQELLERIAKLKELEPTEELPLNTPAERRHVVAVLSRAGIKVNAEQRIVYIGEAKYLTPAIRGTIYHLQVVLRFQVIDEKNPFLKIDNIMTHKLGKR